MQHNTQIPNENNEVESVDKFCKRNKYIKLDSDIINSLIKANAINRIKRIPKVMDIITHSSPRHPKNQRFPVVNDDDKTQSSPHHPKNQRLNVIKEESSRRSQRSRSS